MTVIWYLVLQTWSAMDRTTFWTIFCLFNSLTTQKIKILKKWKKHLEISSFYICVPKIIFRWCTVPEIRCVMDLIIFILGHFLLFNPPNKPKNQNFEKMKKTPGDIIILHMCKLWSDDVRFLRYGAWRM